MSDGSLLAWGLNAEGQCNVPPLPAGVTWTGVDGGGFHSLATRSDGSAAAWGLNLQSQCVVYNVNAGANPAIGAAAGGSFSLVLRANGSVSQSGVIGSGTSTSQIPGGPHSGFAAGTGHCLLRRSDGSVVGIGLDAYGQIDVPALPPGLIYAQLAAGNGHSAAIVGPVASSTPVGSGCGGTALNKPVLSSYAPVLGSNMIFNVALGTPGASGFLYASAPAAPTAVSSGCVVRVDLATAVPVMPVSTTAYGPWNQGVWTGAVPVPFVPTLAGAQLMAQVALIGTSSPAGFDLTNGLLITLGYGVTPPSFF
jgi:hypothetical protein